MQALCHTIDPYYFPVPQPVFLQGQYSLVIWVPGGDNRPYKAPIRLREKGNKAYFVRRGSVTKRANHTEEKQLFELAAKIPFDDRMHHQANLKDLSLGLIQAFLKEVDSGLYEASTTINFTELCQQMRSVTLLPEYVKPLNIGLLLFNPHPERYFRGAKVEIGIYHDTIGDRFSEKVCVGPLHHQLREALQFIKSQVIREEVRKVKGQAEALRFYNYPYEAVEEALANAVYHRSYEHQSTIKHEDYCVNKNIRLQR